MEQRTDKRTALLIDAAVNARCSHGYAAAANELAEQGVPLHVIVRVLGKTEERRQYVLILPKTQNELEFETGVGDLNQYCACRV